MNQPSVKCLSCVCVCVCVYVCVCANKQYICAVAVDGTEWGQLSSRRLGRFSGNEGRISLCNLTFCSAVCVTQI